MEIDPHKEIQRVASGELATLNLLFLSKRSGYVLWKLIEIAEAAGLRVAKTGSLDKYVAYKEIKECQGSS